MCQRGQLDLNAAAAVADLVKADDAQRRLCIREEVAMHAMEHGKIAQIREEDG